MDQTCQRAGRSCEVGSATEFGISDMILVWIIRVMFLHDLTYSELRFYRMVEEIGPLRPVGMSGSIAGMRE